MSYCCNTCRHLDTRGALDALHEVAFTIGWDKVAANLIAQAAAPEVRAAVEAWRIEETARQERLKQERQERDARKAAKAQERRTKLLFRPPLTANLVSTNPPQTELPFS